MRYLTEEEKKEIRRLHLQEGLNTVSIGRIINRSQSTIEGFLKRENILRKYLRIELSSDIIKDIIYLYKSGKSSGEIFKLYFNKVKSQDSILHILKKNNIERRDPNSYSVVKNHNYFETIDTKEKAYFLGLLIADGSIIKQKGNKSDVIRLELQESDKYIIEKFANEIEYSGSFCKTPCGYSIAFSSKKMSSDLEKIGVVKNKTYIGTYLPKIKDDFMSDLIRGIFDGDGTVYFDKNKNFNWGFYGSYEICNQIQDYLSVKLNFNKNKVFNKGTVSFVYLHSKERTSKFYIYIYNNASVYMIRKKEKFDLYCDNTEISKRSKNLLPS